MSNDNVLKLSGKKVAVPMYQGTVSEEQTKSRLHRNCEVTKVQLCEVLGQTVRTGEKFLDFSKFSLADSDSREGVEVELVLMQLVEPEGKVPFMQFAFTVPVTKYGTHGQMDQMMYKEDVFRVLNGTLFVVLD